MLRAHHPFVRVREEASVSSVFLPQARKPPSTNEAKRAFLDFHSLRSTILKRGKCSPLLYSNMSCVWPPFMLLEMVACFHASCFSLLYFACRPAVPFCSF